jgi:hypothetical protein
MSQSEDIIMPSFAWIKEDHQAKWLMMPTKNMERLIILEPGPNIVVATVFKNAPRS